ncbi:MAG: cache domain-containing protein [Candidatus Riflebacteria bacterium]|nr:cache domain-containing protein [Candidatus Riflebacteria bacterium]
MKEEQNKYIFSTPQFQVKEYKFYPITEGLLSGIVMLVILSFSVWFMYWRGYDAVLQEIKDGLGRLASVAALSVDGDVHRSFKSTEQKNDPNFIKMSNQLEEIRKAMKNIKYIYTNVMVGDKVYFVLDPSPQDDNNGDGKPDEPAVLFSEEYSEAPETMKKALREHITVVEDIPTSDRWGTFLSAYAPFFDKKGEFVGILGLDLELTGFKERLKNVLSSTKRLAIISVVFAVLFGVSMWFNRKFAMHLNQSRLQMLADFKRSIEYATRAQNRENMILEKLSEIVFVSIKKSQEDSPEILEEITKLGKGLQYLANIDCDDSKELKVNFDFRKLIEATLKNAMSKFLNKGLEIKLSVSSNVPELLSGNPDTYSLIFKVLFGRIFQEVQNREIKLEISVEQEMLQEIVLKHVLVFSGNEPIPRTLHELLEQWKPENYENSNKIELPDIREPQVLKLFLKKKAKWQVKFSEGICTTELLLPFSKYIEKVENSSDA